MAQLVPKGGTMLGVVAQGCLALAEAAFALVVVSLALAAELLLLEVAARGRHWLEPTLPAAPAVARWARVEQLLLPQRQLGTCE